VTPPERLALEAIARTVSEIEPHPKDLLETAVVLEILGYSDSDARALGFRDVFDLADGVRGIVLPYAWDEPLREPPRARESGVRLYLSGLFYNVGWVIMLIALFLGGQSLWAARDLPVSVGTAIGLGVVLGLVSTGGLQQFAAWKLIYYHLQGNRPLAKFVMERTLVFGGIIVVVLSAGFFAVAATVIGLPLEMAALGSLYLTLIGFYRLAMAPVYAMRKFVALIVISVLALAAMFGIYRVLVFGGVDRPLAVIASQVAGLGVMLGTSVASMNAFVFADRDEPRRPEDPPFYAAHELPKHVNPPRFWVLVVEGVPYLLYGTMYFVFLFADRLVSWFGGPGPFAINYNGPYQIGVDLALLMLVPITAVKFPLLYRFSEVLEKISKAAPAVGPDLFTRGVAAFHNRLTLRVAAAAVSFAGVAFLFGPEIVGFAGGDSRSVLVFRIALVGVVLFSLYLSNAVFAMAFRRIGAMGMFLFVGAILNYGLSAFFAANLGTNAAVLGFLLSSFFLAVASFAYLLGLRRSPDYAYYSAF